MRFTESKQLVLFLVFGLSIFFYSLLGVLMFPSINLAPIDQIVQAQSIGEDKPDVIIPIHSEILFIMGITGGVISIIAALVKGIRWLKSEVVKEVDTVRKESVYQVEVLRKDLTYKVENIHVEFQSELKEATVGLRADVGRLSIKMDADKQLHTQRLNFQDEQLKDLKRVSYTIRDQYDDIDAKVTRNAVVVDQAIEHVKDIKANIKSNGHTVKDEQE
jgi:hypothetical protein